MKTHHLPFCTLLAVLLASLAAQGATYTWTGAGFFGNKDYLWSNPNNWAGLSAPQDGEHDVQIVFPNTGAPRASTNDVVNLVIASFVFQGANYNIHAAGANTVTLTLAGANGSPWAIAAVANGCSFDANTRLHLGSAGTVAVASGSTLVVKSRVSGIYGLTKSSPGTLSFQGLQANTFTGPLTVLHGVADFRCVGTAVPGALVVGDGDPSSSPIARLYLNDQIGDTSPVTVNANGTLELAGHNDTVGAVTLEGGALVTTLDGILAGTLTLNGNVTHHAGVVGQPGVLRGKVSLGSTTRGFQVDDATELRVEADLSAATAGLTKSGTGRLTLTGANNSYAGFTTVQAGILELSGPAKPGSTANGTVVAQGAQLVLRDALIGDEALSLSGTTNRPVLVFTRTNSWSGPVTLTGDCQLKPSELPGMDDRMTFSGNITGNGSLWMVGWGDVFFTGFGNNTFTGGYHADTGLTHFSKSASALAMGGPLYVGRAEDDFPNAHAIVETLNQIPNGSVVTLRNSGALTADADDTLGPVVFEGGWLMGMNGKFTLSANVTNHHSPGNLASMYGNIVLSAGEHVVDFAEFGILDVQAVLEGPGGITLHGDAGALRYYAANTYTGITRIPTCDLYLIGDGRPGASSAGTVIEGLGWLALRGAHVFNEALTVNAAGGYTPWLASMNGNSWSGPITLNGDLKIQGYAGSELTVGGAISGAGGITYRGEEFDSDDGTLIFAGAGDNTYQGPTTLLEGTLKLNKIGRAIPNSLTIGYVTNGADAATVVCLRPGQLTPAASASQMNDWRLTVNPAGGFHCNGFDQIVPGITTRGGMVSTEGAKLSLQQGWRVEPDSGTSQFFGQLRLNSLFDGFTHHFDVDTNSSLAVWGDVSEAVFTAHVEKQGKGTLSMLSSNSFNGNLTLREGVTLADGSQPYGTVNGHTLIDYDATLITFSGTNSEPFILVGSGFKNQGALIVQGSNYFNGPIVVNDDTRIVTPGTTDLAAFLGAIDGVGGITKLGDGRLLLGGGADNTYSGSTRVVEGALELSKTNAVAIRGALEIALGGGGGIVRYLRSDQVSDLSPVTVGAQGQLRLLGQGDLIGSLAGEGIVELLGGSLLTGNNNTETTFAGVISGLGGSLTKVGTGTFTLAGNNVYTGSTSVKGGTLLVRGQQPLSDVTIQTGGTLAGNGTVGVISDLNGHVKPGPNSYGILKCAGFLTHNPANVFQIEINGTVPGLNQDQLDVAGGVTLMGGTLSVAMNFTGAVSNQYVIIRNDGPAPVTGTFTGLPQDGTLTANGVVFRIDYHGGDGNDVVLVQQNVSGDGPQINTVTLLTDGSFQIGGAGIPGITYDVLATSDLGDPNSWQKIGAVTAKAPDGAFSFVDPDAPNFPRRFYRLKPQ